MNKMTASDFLLVNLNTGKNKNGEQITASRREISTNYGYNIIKNLTHFSLLLLFVQLSDGILWQLMYSHPFNEHVRIEAAETALTIF